MAGGIGSRFWPFSTNERPKQFLDFFGTGRSLLQMTVQRFRKLVPIEHILIATNVAYKPLILEQIPELKPEQILCEPARRNTAPCIAYAMAKIRSIVESESESEFKRCRVIVAPSDHLILDEAEFQRVAEQALDFASENDALITLGMKPTRPETGYGYIKCRVESLECREVESVECRVKRVEAFKEKPDLETAKQYVAAGDYLWNAGIFVWNLNSIEQAFKNYLPDIYTIFDKAMPVLGTDQEEAYIQAHFPECQNISIDYGVMEPAKNVYVIPADFGWSDLGTWGSLYALSEKGEGENVALHGKVRFYNARRNIVAIEDRCAERPASPEGPLSLKDRCAERQGVGYVVVEGVDDMIIAESGGVLLICKQQDEQQIRQFVSDYELSKL